jgi:hypothetical protein
MLKGTRYPRHTVRQALYTYHILEDEVDTPFQTRCH